MKRFLLVLALTASAVAQTQTAPVSYRVSDITLYGLGERFAVFSGEPGTIRHDGKSLALTRASRGVAGLDVTGSVRVNGQGALPLPAPKLTAFTLVQRMEGGYGRLILTTRVALSALYSFNGTRWFTLAGATPGGQSSYVYPDERSGGLYGAGTLTNSEAQALGTYLQTKGQYIVVGVIPTTPARASFSPVPASYRSTALFVQTGLPAVSEAAVAARVIRSDLQSLYTDANLEVRLDAKPEEFYATWQLVRDNQVPLQSAPLIDFKRFKIVTVFQGQRFIGGYGVGLLASSVTGETLTLEIRASEPAPSAFTTQVSTSPYLMLEVSNRITEVTEVKVKLVPLQR